MLIIIFLFILTISFTEIFGWLNPLSRIFTSAIIFIFLFYQYHRIRQFGKAKSLSQEELTRTNEIIHALLTTMNLNKLLSLIMNNLTREKNFDSAFIYFIEKDNTLRCIATKGAVTLSGIRRFTFTLEDRDKIIGRTIKSGLPVMVQDTKKNYMVDREITDKLQLKQCIFLPLVVQDKILGLIITGNSKTKIDFTSRDLSVLNTISNQAAIALRNAQLYSKIEELSIIDELTQIYNHRFFQQKIREEVELARRYNSILSLSIIDIDFFKNYNDRNGHLAGDTCLKQVAKIILQSLRKTDIVARYGGEEFAIILPATDKFGATRIIEKIRYDIERYPFEFRHNQPAGKLTISAGIATFPDDTKESRKLIELADQSLYQAKKLGRNRVIVCVSNTKIQQQFFQARPPPSRLP